MSSLLRSAVQSPMLQEVKENPYENKFVFVLERQLKQSERKVLQKVSCIEYNYEYNRNLSIDILLQKEGVNGLILSYDDKFDRLYLEKSLEFIKEAGIRIIIVRRRFIDTTLEDISNLVIKKIPKELIEESQDEIFSFFKRQRLRKYKSGLIAYGVTFLRWVSKLF